MRNEESGERKEYKQTGNRHTNNKPMEEALSPLQSETTITELMIPSYANLGGKIHGGILLSMMDKLAYACATKHSGKYCVTVSVEDVDFMQPVEVGDLVSMLGRVNHVGNSSMVVGIRVLSENVKDRHVKHTNTSYFTMVAKDDDGKPTEVPKLILEKDDDVRRFIEAMVRKYMKNSFQEEMDRVNNAFTTPDHKDLPAENADFEAQKAADPVFSNWVNRNTHTHKKSGYAIVTLTLKQTGEPPGDATGKQMDDVADMADSFSFGELRISHNQNVILADVELSDLYQVWVDAKKLGFATPNLGLLTDMIC